MGKKLENLEEDYRALLVNYGDIIHNMNFRELVKWHLALKRKKSDLLGTIAISTNATLALGLVRYGQGLLIEDFEENPLIQAISEGWAVNMGVALFEREILNMIEGLINAGVGNDLFGSIIPRLVDRNYPIGVYKYDGEWIDIGLKVKQHNEKYPFIRFIIQELMRD